MLNCRDLTRLVSESFERKLTFGERLSLLFHISMCGTCRRFRQLQFQINAVVRQFNAEESPAGNDNDPLPAQSRARIKQAVLAATDGDESPSDDHQDV